MLKAYTTTFDPRFLGLYGTLKVTEETAKAFRIHYTKQKRPDSDYYSIDHSAGTYLYGPDGRLRLYVKYGEKPEVIAADIRALLAGK